MKPTITVNKRALTNAQIPTQIQPQAEFIRIPAPKAKDPVFGIGRGHWYRLERDGFIRFKRLRLPGNTKGITVIPVAEAREALNKLTVDGGNR